MQPQFEIETVFKPANRETIYVFAKLLNDTSFQLNDNSKLGDIEVEYWFDKPSAHNKKVTSEQIYLLLH